MFAILEDETIRAVHVGLAWLRGKLVQCGQFTANTTTVFVAVVLLVLS